MIVSGDESVYSVEMEQAVVKHALVSTYAVIGVPDAEWGERVHAAVPLKVDAGASAKDICGHYKTLIGG